MRRSSVVIASFFMAALPEVCFADPPIGNLGQEERAEVVFRTLAGPLPSDHGGVYVVYSDTQTTSPTDPSNTDKHTIVEMVGLTGTSFDVACVPLFAAVASTSGIAQKTLTSFVNAARYWGSYRNPAFSILRGQGEADGTRMGILRVAAQLRERNPSVPYAVNPGECVYRLLTNYMSASGSGATVDIGEITRMRSDAFVEYAYAANDVQILQQNITNRSDMQYVDRRAAFYNPRTQRARLQPTEIEYPVITLIDGISGAPLPNMATSTTSIKIRVQDQLSGPGRLELSKNGVLFAVETTAWDGTSHTYSSADTGLSTMSNLANGQYVARAIDQAGNVTSGAFTVSTSSSQTPSAASGSDFPQTSYVNSGARLQFTGQDDTVGVCMMTFGNPISSATFPGPAVAVWGLHSGISQGTHTVTTYNCAGSSAPFSFYQSHAASDSMEICASSTTQQCTTRTPNAETIINGTVTIEVDVKDPCPADWDAKSSLTVEGLPANQFDSANCRQWRTIGPPAQSVRFQVSNLTGVDLGAGFKVVGIVQYINNHRAELDFSSAALNSGKVVFGTTTIADVGQTYPVGSSSATMPSPFLGLSISSSSCPTQLLAARRQGLSGLGECWIPHGSDFLLTTEAPLTIVAQDTGAPPAVDTTTLRIYQWAGSSWTLNGLTHLGVSKSTTTGVVISSAALLRSATCAMLYSVVDASAPTTTWTVQGSSSAFAGITLISTYSYLILSSTDPTVNGFASGLATTYYRIDGLPGDAYSAYSSSLSFLPGTNWVDFYATDYAGNVSAVQRTTFTVTAGDFTWVTDDLTVDGSLLVGFLGSGAKAEVVARAEYDYALMVSSVDGRAMLAVDNANFASIGTAPASGRLTLAAASQEAALALRSGNSTASVTGAQLAFGFDGSGDLRHRLYTQHGSAANFNKMVFALWTPASGSSSTLGALPVLSLEGSTITSANALAHVVPAGIADKELVVSNGSAMGEGDVLRWERWVPSATILKKDIERLGKAEEEKAWADVAALRPVEYHRKTDPPGAQLERGYIYEETPLSIRDGPGAASVDERLVNAELALKAAIRRIEDLKARIKKLKERGP